MLTDRDTIKIEYVREALWNGYNCVYEFIIYLSNMVPPHKNVLCTSSIVFKKKILNYSLFYVTIAWNSALLGSKVFF